MHPHPTHPQIAQFGPVNCMETRTLTIYQTYNQRLNAVLYIKQKLFICCISCVNLKTLAQREMCFARKGEFTANIVVFLTHFLLSYSLENYTANIVFQELQFDM